MAATMHDVARLAGVSIKTVSNVVNGYPHIRETTRARVLAAIDELDYQLNVAARNLRTGRTGIIALAVTELSLPYFAELADSVIEAADVPGLTVLIEQTGGRRAHVPRLRRPRHLAECRGCSSCDRAPDRPWPPADRRRRGAPGRGGRFRRTAPRGVPGGARGGRHPGGRASARRGGFVAPGDRSRGDGSAARRRGGARRRLRPERRDGPRRAARAAGPRSAGTPGRRGDRLRRDRRGLVLQPVVDHGGPRPRADREHSRSAADRADEEPSGGACSAACLRGLQHPRARLDGCRGAGRPSAGARLDPFGASPAPRPGAARHRDHSVTFAALTDETDGYIVVIQRCRWPCDAATGATVRAKGPRRPGAPAHAGQVPTRHALACGWTAPGLGSRRIRMRSIRGSRSHRRRWVATGISAAMVVTALTACSGGGTTGGTGSTESAPADGGGSGGCTNQIKVPDAEQVTVWAWYPAFEAVVDLFNTTHNDVQICWSNAGQGNDEYTKFSTTIEAGTGAPYAVRSIRPSRMMKLGL